MPLSKRTHCLKTHGKSSKHLANVGWSDYYLEII